MATQEMPQIKAESRDRLGTRYAARLRESGRLPAVIYGHKQDPIHISLDEREIVEMLHEHSHLIEVTVDGKAEACLVKDVQWNHLGSKLVHIDLARVDLDERVTVEVTLQIVGESPAMKEPGVVLEHPLDAIEIECLVTQIPEVIRVDISGLGVGESLTVADVKLPEGVTAVTDEDTVVASISEVTEEPEPEIEAGEEEPEVIGRKPEDEEEAEAKK